MICVRDKSATLSGTCPGLCRKVGVMEFGLYLLVYQAAGMLFPAALFYCRCFCSMLDLRAPSADRRETLPCDRKYVRFYNPGP